MEVFKEEKKQKDKEAEKKKEEDEMEEYTNKRIHFQELPQVHLTFTEAMTMMIGSLLTRR